MQEWAKHNARVAENVGHSDGGLGRWSERRKTTQTHVTYEFGITPRVPLELWVSVTSNSPFQRDALLKLAWRVKEILAPIPLSFEVRASRKGSAIFEHGLGSETRTSLILACLTPFPVHSGAEQHILNATCLEHSSPSWRDQYCFVIKRPNGKKAEVCVHAGPFPNVGKMKYRPEAIERWEGQVERFRLYSSFTKMQ